MGMLISLLLPLYMYLREGPVPVFLVPYVQRVYSQVRQLWLNAKVEFPIKHSFKEAHHPHAGLNVHVLQSS